MSSSVAADAYILFSIAGTTYALSSEDMRHMEMVEQITPVPNAPDYLEGVVLSRGEIVPVVNLRARFGFDRVPHDLATRLLMLRSGDRSVAVLVDSAREFVKIPGAAIEPPSNAIAGTSGRYLRGIATMDSRLILVLDAASLLDTATMTGNGAEPGSAAG
jgi:purine-binding chemotaxis protein CheW